MTTPGALRATSPGLRVVRALPFATVCVLVSALGHARAGGGPVPLPTLLAGLLLVALPAAALAGRERGLPAIAGGLAVGELGLHALFHLCAGTAIGSTMAGMPAMAGGASDPIARLAASLLCGPDQGGGLSLPPGTTAWEIVTRAGLDPHAYLASPPAHSASGPLAVLGLTPAMLAGHLLAALVAGWWLRRGEAALFRLLTLALEPLRALVRQLVTLFTAALAARPDESARLRLPRRAAEPWRLPGRVRLRHQLVRRGPPRALLV